MTSRPIQPDELLALAERLVGTGAGRGRPKTVELRRGVSTAYYGLFHDLSWRGTTALLDEGPAWSPRAGAVSRWVTRTGLRQLTDAVTGLGPVALRDAMGPVDPSLVKIADAFSTLQDERHRADDDDFYDVRRPYAKALVTTAGDALDLTRTLAQREEPSFTLFLRLMLSAAHAKKRS